MYMIEILALDNGAHRNQTYNGVLPDGWALTREDVKTLENFPFGEVTAEKVDGLMTMTDWNPAPLPPVEPEPVDPEPTAEELIEIMLGVNRYE